MLPEVVGSTLWLLLGVSTAAAVLGTGLAWLTARYRFPGLGLLHVALLLPLALPGYVLGFVFIAGFDYAGPLQSYLRETTASKEAFWQVRNAAGAGLTLVCTLYPYVYLIAYNAFRSISSETVEAAQTLGHRKVFFRIALPLARPWILGASLLVAMETLADFGTVSLFNVDTFTTAIYKSWFGLFDLSAALQLACALILVALLLMWAHSQTQSRGSVQQNPARPLSRLRLRGWHAWLSTFGLSSFVFIVAGLPILTLASWSWQHMHTEWDSRYFLWLGHSLSLALGSAGIICGAALLLAYLNRADQSRYSQWFSRSANLGYALPGTLIAVGIFAPMAAIEKPLAPLLGQGWVTQSLFLIFLAYCARFLTVAHTPIAQQMHRLSRSLDEVSRSLGVSGWRLLNRVHRPLLGRALASAAALIVIDVIKEMPITLMTRPFGRNTLATRVFELTAEGEYQRAALPSLTIVIAGLIPIALLLRRSRLKTSPQAT